MTFETSIPPEIRHFDPHCGWTSCPYCKGLVQSPRYDENNDYYQDADAVEVLITAHYLHCTSTTPYIDPDWYYPNPNDSNDPELKCYGYTSDYVYDPELKCNY